MKHEITILYVACPDRRIVNKISLKLLQDKAAACVQSFSVESKYPWNGKIENTNEIVLIAKTLNKKLSKAVSIIKKNHTYQVPCILNYSAKVNKEYYYWMKEILG
jgi:periplasmic divalent cation tolerance protein